MKYGSLIESKGQLLTPQEQQFFERLEHVVGDDYAVLSKVRLADLVNLKPEVKWNESKHLVRRLESERLDFIICRKRDFSVFGIFETSSVDSARSEDPSAQRHLFLKEIAEICGVKLFSFDLRRDFKKLDLRRMVFGRYQSARRVSLQESISATSVSENSSISAILPRKCPKCNREVKIKMAAKGKDIGKKFFMCSSFPYCDFKMPLEEAVEHFKSGPSSKKGGYNRWS